MTPAQLYDAICMFIDGENDDSNHNGLARKSYSYNPYDYEVMYLKPDEERAEVKKFVKWYMEEVACL